MNESSQQIADAITRKGAGKTAGIIACVLAVLGTLFLGFVFVPLAVIVGLFGTIIAVKNKNPTGIGICALAWVLIMVGFATSPVLITMIARIFTF